MESYHKIFIQKQYSCYKVLHFICWLLAKYSLTYSMIGNDKKGDFMNDITQGYQPLPQDKWGCDITPTEEADKDCVCCWGEGEVQCSFGDSYYYDTCYCVLVKYWKNIGNLFMADGMEKLLANVIRLKTL